MTFKYPFYFLRHGETDWNLNKKTQGQIDSSLNATGFAQASVAAEILKDHPIERIVSSPLSRVRSTAETVAKHHDVEISFDDGLRECHLGEMQGQPHGPWLRQYWKGEFDPPGGEKFSEFSSRVWDAMQRAVALGPNTLIVAHGGLWIAAHQFVTIEPHLMPMPNALPVFVTPSGEKWQQQVLDETREIPTGASV